MTLLSATNLGKSYCTYRSEWQRFAGWFGLPIKPKDEHWVLRNINFDIQPGEAVGIIGQNGVGKSTLLKMITGTLQPTEGQVQINGSIAAILELGMGFNPELTGRQNVFHVAGLMGFSAEQIQQAIPDIEAFAEIGEYFDEPARIYSSGMQMRAAFSVATAFRPDILIVDEALSVGDAAFQRKCFRRIETYMNDGMALLLVSHDIESIKKICSKALFLKDGFQQGYGEAKRFCDEYERVLFGAEKLNPIINPDQPSGRYDASLVSVSETSYGNSKAKIDTCWIQGCDGEKANVVETSSQLVWCFDVTFNVDVSQPFYNMQVKTSEGIVLFGVNSEFLGYKYEHVHAGTVVKVRFSLVNHLAPGTYFLNCGVKEYNHENVEEFLHRRVDAAMLTVVANTEATAARGIVDLEAQILLSLCDDRGNPINSPATQFVE